MGKILCATRGGEASYRTQDAAIALAQERGDTLVFLYVVDLHFLDKTAAAVVVDVEREMTKMGRFLLLMAQERAAEQGVEADTVCSRGSLRQALVDAARQEEATMIVFGRPVGDASVFQVEGLQEMAAELESETGVETRII